jgi:hypothetical protein
VQVAIKSDADMAQLQRLMADHAVTRLFLVESHDGELDPADRVRSQLDSHWRRQELFHQEPIAIRVYQR